MKYTMIVLMILLATLDSEAQKADTTVRYDGLYIAKTGDVPAANLEIFTYLRFYDDGTVYLQAVTSNDPKAVSKWFGRDKKFSQKGTYQIDGKNIIIKLNNKDSEDAKLEGFVETKYKGTLKDGNQICLTRDEEKTENCFLFYKSP